MGDSVAFGWGLAEHETLSSQLELQLLDRGLDVEALNGGTPGYDTLNEIAYLEKVGLPLAPREVILVVSMNDLSSDSRPRPHLNPQGFMTNREDDDSVSWMERHSEFYVIARWFVEGGQWRNTFSSPEPEPAEPKGARKKSGFPLGNWRAKRRLAYADLSSPRWVTLVDSLVGIRALCRERGIDLSLALFPDEDQATSERPDLSPQARWLWLCGALDLHCVDLQPVFANALDPGSLYRDHQHPSARGAKVAAKALSDSLAAQRP